MSNIKTLLRIIQHKNLQSYRTIATVGDCGIFAVALAQFIKDHFDIDVEIALLIDDPSLSDSSSLQDLEQSETDWMHVFVTTEEESFDITGIVTADKLHRYEQYYGTTGNLIFIPYNKNIIRAIRSNTNYSNSPQLYYDILLKTYKEIMR